MKVTRDHNLLCGGIKYARPFNEKNLPQLIRLYKKGWTIAALKRKFRCYGNPITRLLVDAGVYRKSCMSAMPEYSTYSAWRWLSAHRWHTKFLFKSFGHFLNEIGPRPSDKHRLRRIDVKGHIAPGNVHWQFLQCDTPEYVSYTAAKYRCTSPKCGAWESYGGRGIQFRFASLEEFIAELGPRPPGTTLDRIDVNGHYEKGNVRWSTAEVQMNNRRCSIKDVEEDEIPEAP